MSELLLQKLMEEPGIAADGHTHCRQPQCKITSLWDHPRVKVHLSRCLSCLLMFFAGTLVGHNQEMDNIAYSLPRIGIGEASNASCSSNK